MAFDKKRAQGFVKRWQAADGNEEREFRSYVIELCQDVLGIEAPTRVLDFERRVRGRRADVVYEDQSILVEGKSKSVDLDHARDNGKYGLETPYQQARWYYDKLPRSAKPRWLMTSNFDTWRVYDMEAERPQDTMVEVTLEELATEAGASVLSMFTDRAGSRIVKEQELSVAAGEIVAKLYDAFSKEYHNLATSEREQKSLNILIVRLVFLLYAEDSGLMPSHQAVYKFLDRYPAADLRNALIRLFQVLDTPEDERDPYLDPELASFPYVNGGLFADGDVVVPQISNDARFILLEEASRAFDWKSISPTVFGAVFESTLNPETRRSCGMHYTSIDNIHKVIDNLFLDDLKAELAEIEGLKTEKARKGRLRAFQNKLSKIQIFDPACGSGNFLTESFISLRRLENRAIEDLQGDQGALLIDTEESPVKVSIQQMHGIEVNDFAVAVAKTALWIAEAQMLDETQSILWQGGSNAVLDFLPLTTQAGIVEGNALRMDWNDVLPAQRCSYVLGNPPFLGSAVRSESQTDDMAEIAFADQKKWGKIDYCGAWYYMAAKYMTANHAMRSAFVSTNSLCQGEQVEPMWAPLFKMGIGIDFCWRTFVWNSEATDVAHVHCVIVGFSYHGEKRDGAVLSSTGEAQLGNINGYLLLAPSVFIPARSRAVDPLHKPIVQGCKPVDSGGLIVKTKAEADRLVASDPRLEPYVLPFVGSKEFIQGTDRWCLWLKDAPEDVLKSPALAERLDTVRQARLGSPTKEFRDFADRPHLFAQDRKADTNYLIVPSVSSQRREYVPIGHLPPNVVTSNLAYMIPRADLFDFAMVSNRAHTAWLRTIAGRLKSDYRYSPVVYNAMAYPDVTAAQREDIERLSQAVLNARDAHPDKSLAQLYDPDKMPTDLLAAHKALDAAVLAAYGLPSDASEEDIVAHLFKLYAELTKDQK